MVTSTVGKRSKRVQNGGRYRIRAELKTSPIKVSSYKMVEKGTTYLSGDENAYSLQKLEGYAQQCLSQIRSFRTILLPVVHFEKYNNEENKTHIATKTLFEEACEKFIGKAKCSGADVTASSLIRCFRNDFIDSNGSLANTGLQRRQAQQSPEIHQILENMWRALQKTSTPNKLTKDNCEGQHEMYENLYHRLAQIFPRRRESTREAFLEVDWSSDHTVEVHVEESPRKQQRKNECDAQNGKDEPEAAQSRDMRVVAEQGSVETRSTKMRSKKLFSKEDFKAGMLTIVEIFGGQLTASNISRRLKSLYERLFLRRLRHIETGAAFFDLVEKESKKISHKKRSEKPRSLSHFDVGKYASPFSVVGLRTKSGNSTSAYSTLYPTKPREIAVQDGHNALNDFNQRKKSVLSEFLRIVVAECKIMAKGKPDKKKVDENDLSAASEQGETVKKLMDSHELHKQRDLKQLVHAIWNLADLDRDGVLNKADYRVMYHKLYRLYHSLLSILENNDPVIITKEMEELDFEHDWQIDSMGTHAVTKERFLQCFADILGRDGEKEKATSASTVLNAIDAIEFTNFLNLIFSFIARTNKSEASRIYWRDDAQICTLAARMSSVLLKNPQKIFKRLRKKTNRPIIVEKSSKDVGTGMTITILSKDRQTEDSDKKLLVSRPFQMLDQVATRRDLMKAHREVQVEEGKPKKPLDLRNKNVDEWVDRKFQNLCIHSKWSRKKAVNRRVSPFSSQQPARLWPKGIKEAHFRTPGGMPSGNIVPHTGSPFSYMNPNHKEEPATRYGTTLKRSVSADPTYGQLGKEELLNGNRISYVSNVQSPSFNHRSTPPTETIGNKPPVEMAAFGRTSSRRRPASAGTRRKVSPHVQTTADDAVYPDSVDTKNSLKKHTRELHSSQSALLNGMKVSALVNSLSQPIKLMRSPTKSNFLISPSHRRKRKERPKSAGVRRCKPGTLSKAVRVATTTGYNDRRRRRIKNQRKSPRSRTQPRERPPSATSMLLRGRKNMSSLNLNDNEIVPWEAPSNGADLSVNDNPWSVFQSGGDYRMQKYGDNKAIGSALLKVDFPREFAKSVKVEVPRVRSS